MLLTDYTTRRTAQGMAMTEEAKAEFLIVWEYMPRGPLMYSPNPAKEYIFATDTADVPVGACLSAMGTKKVGHLMAFLK